MPYSIRILIVVSALIASLQITACQRKEAPAPEPTKVNIKISSPNEAEVFSKGDTVHINANVSYISQLHGYEVLLKDKASGAVYAQFENHVHADQFDVAEAWTDTVSTATDITVTINVFIDHDGTKTTAEVEIQSRP